MRDEVDLRRLRILYRAWDETPPAHESNHLLCELVKRAWFKPASGSTASSSGTKTDDVRGFADALIGAGFNGYKASKNPYQ